MKLESIRNKLPLDMQKLLEVKPDGAWFDTLYRKQEQSSRNGEHLATLFRYMVNNQVDEESIKDLSKILSSLAAKNGLEGLSEVAKETYRKAESIFTAAHPSTTGKKRKGDDALEGEPSAKKQARIEMTEGDTIRSKIASQSTLLPKELSNIVGEYAVDVLFPWKGEVFSLTASERGEPIKEGAIGGGSGRSERYEYRLFYLRSAGSPVKEIRIEIKNIITDCTGVESGIRCDIPCQFMVILKDGDRNKNTLQDRTNRLQDYCEHNNIQYSTKDIFKKKDDIIMFCKEKKDAKAMIKFLSEHNTFSKTNLEDIDREIDKKFPVYKNINKEISDEFLK